ncbi:MAG: CapA family protein [Spirochaetales bacterium]|nr:CapA family protein [Spirochaetales bacterium]
MLLIFLSCEKTDKSLLKEPEAESRESTQTKSPSITMKIVGDILTTRNVYKKMQGHRFDDFYQYVKAFISDADLSFANLENPLSEIGKATDIKKENITFRAPTQSAFRLLDAGFDIVSLANNHIMDYGPDAMFETMALLDLIQIRWIGTGANEIEARLPRYLRVKNKIIAFLAYCDEIYGAQLADKNSPGPPLLTKKAVLEDVFKVKQRKIADYIFVSLHWGPEMMIHHKRDQVDLAHEILDTGADMIIGHHPHVLQGIEFYKGKPIIYSLGNFTFDMDTKWTETYRSMIVSVGLGDRGVERFEVYPVRIPYFKYYPTLAKGEDAKEILKDIIDRSSIYYESPFIYGEGFIYVDQEVLAKKE